MQPNELYDLIEREKVIAIVRGVAADAAVAISDAMCAGGIRLMEITCNTPGALEMIRAVNAARGDRLFLGAGTVVTRALAEEAIAAGARYIIAPDVNPEVIGCCIERQVAVIPGAATATEILTAWRLGASMVKLFPAEALGTAYVKQLRAPIGNVDLVAVGGIDADNITSFLRAGCCAVGVGGSLVDRALVERRDWSAISARARQIRTNAMSV